MTRKLSPKRLRGPSRLSCLLDLAFEVKNKWNAASLDESNFGPDVAVWSTLLALGWKPGRDPERWQLDAAERFLMAAIEEWDK